MCTLYLGLATSQNKARKTHVRVHVLVRRRVGACKSSGRVSRSNGLELVAGAAIQSSRAYQGFFIWANTERAKAESGGEVLGEGRQLPPHQLGDLEERCEFLKRGSGSSPTA